MTGQYTFEQNVNPVQIYIVTLMQSNITYKCTFHDHHISLSYIHIYAYALCTTPLMIHIEDTQSQLLAIHAAV